MASLVRAPDAFLQEYQRCGELAGGVDGERVWMAFYCGAEIVQPLDRHNVGRLIRLRFAAAHRSAVSSRADGTHCVLPSPHEEVTP